MEIDNSIYLIEVALATLQKYGESQGGNFLFMLLMSTGLERLMKIIMNLSEYKESNRFLSSSELKNYGHDLIELRDAVFNMLTTLSSCTDTLQQEFRNLIKDELLYELLRILSDFAKGDRYKYLDGIQSPVIPERLPSVRWDRAISKNSISSDQLVSIFESFTLLLANVLIECNLLDTAEVASPRLLVFVDIAEKHRGLRQYSL